MYREFTTAVQRRHIQIPVKYSRVVAQQGTQVGDLQAGRPLCKIMQLRKVSLIWNLALPNITFHTLVHGKDSGDWTWKEGIVVFNMRCKSCSIVSTELYVLDLMEFYARES